MTSWYLTVSRYLISLFKSKKKKKREIEIERHVATLKR